MPVTCNHLSRRPPRSEFRNDEKGVGAGHHRHERRDERESEDLRVDEAHTFRRRKQPAAWSFTIPTACMNA